MQKPMWWNDTENEGGETGSEIKGLSKKLVVGVDGRRGGEKKSSNEGRKMEGEMVKREWKIKDDK